MAAVAQNDGNTILFQANKNFEIISYESCTPSGGVPRKKYDMNTVKIKGKSIKVNPKLPIISAVAFTHPESCGGRAQTRAYYVDRDSLFLRKITGVGDKSFQIKVYYQRDGADEFSNDFVQRRGCY